MSITFNSTGGFLNGTISSSNGDLFITTSGSVGKITLGNTEYTGSEVIEKDASGNVRNKKIFNSDGTTTLQKFDANETLIETKIKNPITKTETIQSASATSNQIVFEQSDAGASIILSGSSAPFIGIVNAGGSSPFAPKSNNPKMSKAKKLSPKQMKIAKLAGNPNKIDAQDFAKLRGRS